MYKIDPISAFGKLCGEKEYIFYRIYLGFNSTLIFFIYIPIKNKKDMQYLQYNNIITMFIIIKITIIKAYYYDL